MELQYYQKPAGMKKGWSRHGARMERAYRKHGAGMEKFIQSMDKQQHSSQRAWRKVSKEAGK